MGGRLLVDEMGILWRESSKNLWKSQTSTSVFETKSLLLKFLMRHVVSYAKFTNVEISFDGSSNLSFFNLQCIIERSKALAASRVQTTIFLQQLRAKR